VPNKVFITLEIEIRESTIMKTVRLRISLYRREIMRWFMVILFVIGSVLTGLATYFYVVFVTAPVYSFKTGYSGFGIAHNESIIPMLMTVGVAINPPELWFDYYFSCYMNGTYNFIFAFPFNIMRQIRVSENMSTKSTPHGSAIWLQCRVNNVSSYGLDHEIWGDFAIENTFQEGTRGSYTIILPFGMGISPEVTEDLWQALKVPFYSGDINVTLYVALPGGFRPTTMFPPNSRGPELYKTPFNVTIDSTEWDAGRLQNSVTIEAIDVNEKPIYDNIPFTSGILFGIGVQLMFTIGYDSIRRWARSPIEKS
jgi:hypothetical protein